MKAKIYVIPGSHPCAAVLAAARHKGLDFERVDFAPAMHKLQLRLLRFPGDTAPALRYGEQKVVGSRAIMRTFESIHPEPPLFPADKERRAAVEAAERWGDGDFQDIGRRLIWAQLTRDPSTMMSYSEGANLPFPDALSRLLSRPVAKIARRYNHATDERVKRDLHALPALLDHVDGLIADGVIGGSRPNAADFQLASSIALWMTMDDLRPAIENRPCGAVAKRLFPNYPGHIPAGILPAEWLAPVRETMEPAGA